MYLKRFLRLFLGLFCCAVSVSLSIQGNVGVTPWDVFHLGLQQLTGLSYGLISMGVGLVILLVAAVMGEKIGAGTICNTLTVGLMVDAIQATGIIPRATNVFVGSAMVAVGLLFMAVGSFLYIGAAMGAGPRDSMMTALSKRMPKIPVGVIRAAIETTVLILGYFLGGQVGVGTVIGMVGIGPAIQLVFGLTHFDVKLVRHESVFDTARRIMAGAAQA